MIGSCTQRHLRRRITKIINNEIRSRVMSMRSYSSSASSASSSSTSYGSASELSFERPFPTLPHPFHLSSTNMASSLGAASKTPREKLPLFPSFPKQILNPNNHHPLPSPTTETKSVGWFVKPNQDVRASLIANPFGPVLATGKMSNLEDEYEILEDLGCGRYGVVKKVLHRRRMKEYAVKKIAKTKIESVEWIKNEINILTKLNHPNVMKLVDVIENRAYIHLVTELYTGGELYDTIVKFDSLNESKTACIMKHLFESLKYIHDNGVIHRDVKPENLLFSSNDKDGRSRLVLVDFGLSTTFNPHSKEKGYLRAQCGVSLYLSFFFCFCFFMNSNNVEPVN